jgi:sugar lactone lactonase YvrE
MTTNSQRLIGDLAFPEGVRWHEDALWFSDMYGLQVFRLPVEGDPEVIAAVPECPSGLGFLPDGRPLVVSMHDRRLLAIEDGRTSEYADLSGLATWHCNDMLVDRAGRAYVANFGSASAPPEPPTPTILILVKPDGNARAVADDLWFPNGIAVSADGGTLVVAETRSQPNGRLTAFDIDADGGLGNRRTVVEFEGGGMPDGIAIDADDGVWVALPFSDEIVHVDNGGQIDERLSFPSPYAVALGGASGRELFVCTAPTWHPDEAVERRQGSVHRLDHEAGSPAPLNRD